VKEELGEKKEASLQLENKRKGREKDAAIVSLWGGKKKKRGGRKEHVDRCGGGAGPVLGVEKRGRNFIIRKKKKGFKGIGSKEG